MRDLTRLQRIFLLQFDRAEWGLRKKMLNDWLRCAKMASEDVTSWRWHVVH